MNIFSGVSYEATFLVSQAVLYTTLPLFPGKEMHQQAGRFFNLGPKSFQYAVFIVIMTVVVSLVNLYVYQDQIMVSLEDLLVQKIYRLLSYTFIPFAQAGGWLYQSLLVYFLAVVFGTSIGFKKYLTFVGLAYAGFLISTLFSLIINILVFDFAVMEQNIILRYTIGKFGEAFTLILLAFFIYSNEKKFSLMKSCIIACSPTVLIILIQILL
jgi:hypothetical protein